MNENRRNAQRYEVWFPLDVKTERSERTVAITQDVSEKGMLVATPSKLSVGAEVRVSFKLPGPVEIEHVLEGVIVRVEKNDYDRRELWRYRVAIEFDDPLPELETVLKHLSES
jgi:hypothetical protein